MHDMYILMALIITSLVAINFLKQAIILFCPVRVSNCEILYRHRKIVLQVF